MIDVEELSVELGGTEVLTGVSLSVERGELVGVIGPNGSGKTTLIRAIDGLLPPTSGAVRLDGDRVSTLSRSAVSRLVSVVPQSTHIDFEFSVRDVVAMGRTPYAGRFRGGDEGGSVRIEEALQRADVTHLADRPITEVSGGERQRVVFARALAQDTPAILLDEPTASLDIRYKAATFEHIAAAVDGGKAALAAIHDLDLAGRYCDRLLLLHDGSPIAKGRPSDVLRPEHIELAFDANTIVHTNPVTGDRVVVPTGRGADREISVAVIGGGGSATPALRTLVRAGYTPAVGVLRAGELDTHVADALGCEVVSAPAAGPLPADAIERMRDVIEAADVTVFAPVSIDEHNAAILELASAASRVCLIDAAPCADRNFADADAARRYRALQCRARVVSQSELPDAIETLAGAPSPPANDPMHRDL